MKFVKSALRIALVVYLAALAGLFFCQERLLYFPGHLDKDFKFTFDAEEKWLDCSGSKIDSLLFTTPQAPGTLLYFHGNAGDLSTWGEVAHELTARTGWNVWVMDYPGYGKSEGHIIAEEQLHAMARQFWDQLHGKIVIYGRSIGTGIASRLASHVNSAGLILETPYYSLKSVAHQIAPWAPIFLMRYDFPNFQEVPDVKAPIFIVHGDQDEVIPYSQGVKLAAVIPQATFTTIPDGHHNDLADNDLYWQSLNKFLKGLQ